MRPRFSEIASSVPVSSSEGKLLGHRVADFVRINKRGRFRARGGRRILQSATETPVRAGACHQDCVLGDAVGQRTLRTLWRDARQEIGARLPTVWTRLRSGSLPLDKRITDPSSARTLRSYTGTRNCPQVPMAGARHQTIRATRSGYNMIAVGGDGMERYRNVE